ASFELAERSGTSMVVPSTVPDDGLSPGAFSCRRAASPVCRGRVAVLLRATMGRAARVRCVRGKRGEGDGGEGRATLGVGEGREFEADGAGWGLCAVGLFFHAAGSAQPNRAATSSGASAWTS